MYSQMRTSVLLGRRVHFFFPRRQKIYTPGTTANLQRALTEINKNDAFAKVRILVEQVIM